MRALSLIVALALAFAAAFSGPPAQAQGTLGFRMIVNVSNGAIRLDRQFIEDAFLRKIKTWPDGENIRPIDQSMSSPLRERFSDQVLRRPLAALRAYWQQRIFSGRDLPPPAVASDADVIRYVMKNRGAIGYVSENASLVGVKSLPLR
jgi:ABC-type phosphate transport system substrate-binding protein